MSDWAEFAAAFAAFLAAHAIPMRPGLKTRIIRILGKPGYIIVFSVVSVALLYWLLMAAGRAPFIEIWQQAVWQRWIANIAMPFAILLGVFSVRAKNPFSFGGTAEGFDPDRPGIAGMTRHPLMWAFAIWASVHLLANGDLAHLLLFAPLLVFALSGVLAADARARRNLPDFDRLAAHTSLWPFAALLDGRWQPRKLPSLSRLAIAVVLWAGLLHLHPAVIGVSPLP
ncbi:NnrU family protein [Paracoccus aerodenitrificans]|uniref:NnrU family protein n=1 Tax=Paracoccus aerodenitrificans TaxID=3017781 RepID=UPI0022EFE82B|nr:NnrU family protein [Paracoccus aerodenitrificans]WBU63687.1 NnrU family protein [Paracoccus aerodenitrificans]